MSDLLKNVLFILFSVLLVSSCATVKATHNETKDPVFNRHGYKLGVVYPIKFENISGFYIHRIDITATFSQQRFTILNLAHTEISKPIDLQIGEYLMLETIFRGRKKIIKTTKYYKVIKPDNIKIVEN
jgi:hypothetical protein